jgi:hypothetical protein
MKRVDDALRIRDFNAAVGFLNMAETRATELISSDSLPADAKFSLLALFTVQLTRILPSVMDDTDTSLEIDLWMTTLFPSGWAHPHELFYAFALKNLQMPSTDMAGGNTELENQHIDILNKALNFLGQPGTGPTGICSDILRLMSHIYDLQINKELARSYLVKAKRNDRKLAKFWGDIDNPLNPT